VIVFWIRTYIQPIHFITLIWMKRAPSYLEGLCVTVTLNISHFYSITQNNFYHITYSKIYNWLMKKHTTSIYKRYETKRNEFSTMLYTLFLCSLITSPRPSVTGGYLKTIMLFVLENVDGLTPLPLVLFYQIVY